MVDISFSERFTNIASLAQVFESRETKDPGEARQQAQELENDLYRISASPEDYAARLAAALANVKGDAKDAPVSDDDEDVQPVLSPTPVKLGRYESSNHYRDGLFSTVYRAKNPDVEHPEPDPSKAFVALKLTTPAMMVAPHDAHREARILTEARSQHVIPLLETFGLSGGRFVLVMPFMPFDLDHLLRKKRVSKAQAQSHMRDLFSALAFLHKNDMLHRDVKPSNVLLKSVSGPAYLSDFGTAWSAADRASEPADDKITDVGTTAYRPPELLFGKRDYGPPLDLWAAGCVVAEAATLSAETLFEPGDLGTELALINSMFQTLGTPTLDVWPEAARLPDWGKFQWREYPAKPWSEILPKAAEDVRDLVGKLVRYESAQRLGAEEALEHPYFAT